MNFFEQNTDDLNKFKRCFDSLTVKSLRERIDDYKRFISYSSRSEKEITNLLREMFTVEIEKEKLFFYLRTDKQPNPSFLSYLYRIRKFTSKDIAGLRQCRFPSMKNKADGWLPPKGILKDYGRLNRPQQPVLYTSSHSVNAFYEANCSVDDYVFLIIYKTKNLSRLSEIHAPQYIKELSELENAKKMILDEFLLNDFRKYVPLNMKHLYKSSLLIYENFFLDDRIDAFAYPSIATPINMGFNICFSEQQAEKCLDVLGVMICKVTAKGDKSEFRVMPLFDGFLDGDNFTFYQYNSERSKERFGNFAILRQVAL